MALALSVEQDTGISVTYWRVTNINIDWPNQDSTVVVCGYLTEAARRAGKEPVIRKTYRFHPVNQGGLGFPFTIANLDLANPQKVAYAKLKTLDEWKGSADAGE